MAKYTIWHGGNSQNIHEFINPNFDNCKFVMGIEGRFRTRYTMEGSVIFTGDDYNYIVSLAEVIFYVNIYKDGYLYFAGSMNTDSKYDYNSKRVELKCDIIDDYTILDRNKNTSFDLLKNTPFSFYYISKSFQAKSWAFAAYKLDEVFNYLCVKCENVPDEYNNLSILRFINYYITPKSNAKKAGETPGIIDWAPKFEVTFVKFMDYLKFMNLDYYITDYNLLTVDLVWWPNVLKLDFTDFKGKDWTVKNMVYDSNRSNFPKVIKLKTEYSAPGLSTEFKSEFYDWEARNTSFSNNTPIVELQLSDICNDLEYMWIEQSKVSDSGITFVEVDETDPGSFQVKSTFGTGAYRASNDYAIKEFHTVGYGDTAIYQNNEFDSNISFSNNIYNNKKVIIKAPGVDDIKSLKIQGYHYKTSINDQSKLIGVIEPCDGSAWTYTLEC